LLSSLMRRKLLDFSRDEGEGAPDRLMDAQQN
jgi:hypothetical protein